MKPDTLDLPLHRQDANPQGLQEPCARRGGTYRPLSASKAALAWLAALAAGLGGCALPSAAPRLDAELGRATRQALAQQVLRPEAGSQAAPQAGLDGVSAVHALTRHRESFKAPPASFGVLGIGSAGNP